MKKLVLIFFVFFCCSAFAQPLQFDDETTSISFTTSNIIMLLKGSFTGVKGRGLITPKDLSQSYLQIAFGANTAIANDPFVGPDFTKEACFDSYKYPTIQLKSEHIEKLEEENKYLFSGTLTVKNITQQVSFIFTAIPNVGGYDYDFTFLIPSKVYELNCHCGQKFKVTVKGYGKKIIPTS